MAYLMIEYPSKGKYKSIILPVNPEEISIDRDDISTTVNVINKGEVPVPSRLGLIRFTVDTFIPNDKNSPFNSIKDSKTHAGDRKYWKDKIKAFHEKQTVITVSLVGVKSKNSVETRIQCNVVSFSYGWQGGTTDMNISIGFRQYRPINIKTWSKKKKKKSKKSSKKKSSTPSKKGTIKVGSTVVCTGYLYKTSAKTGRGGKETKATRKVSIVKKGAKAPYHVKTTSGGGRGWMEAKDVKLK